MTRTLIQTLSTDNRQNDAELSNYLEGGWEVVYEIVISEPRCFVRIIRLQK